MIYYLYLMRRAIVSIVLLASLCASSQVEAVGFSDLKGTRYTEAVAYLQGKQLVKGYADSKIHPHSPINRAEALKLVVLSQDSLKQRLAYHTKHPARMPLFTDVKNTDWFVNYVETGFDAGLISGYANGAFKPGRQVTLAEALAMMARARGASGGAGATWYDGYLADAKQKNLLSYKEKSWNPGMTLTRGQFMDILYRSLTVQTQGLIAFNDPQPVIVAAPARTVAYGGGYTYTSTYRPASTRYTYTYAPARTVSTVAQAAPSNGFTTVFTISIPALNISTMNVGHPSNPSTQQGLLAPLKDGVGHLYALPGGNGKILVYGHSSSYSYDTSSYTKIFRTINQLKAGDLVTVNYNGKDYRYSVTSQEQIRPDDTSAFSGQGEELILYTCWPPDKIDTRLLVHARPLP